MEKTMTANGRGVFSGYPYTLNRNTSGKRGRGRYEGFYQQIQPSNSSQLNSLVGKSLFS